MSVSINGIVGDVDIEIIFLLLLQWKVQEASPAALGYTAEESERSITASVRVGRVCASVYLSRVCGAAQGAGVTV